MFNLQGSEIIIVLLLALVVLGPEKLPDAMRKMGQAYAELKKMSAGFQSEFKAAVEEPLREIRDTANVLRDSADFTKLQQGEREEKPKSADMLAPVDTDAVPSESVPTFDTPATAEQTPELAEDSKPAPFSGVSSAAPRPAPPTAPTTMPTPPPPFTAMSAPVESAPGPVDDTPPEDAVDAVTTTSWPAPVTPAAPPPGDDGDVGSVVESAMNEPSSDDAGHTR